MADVQPYLQRMIDRFADPAVQASMKGFTKTLLFKFTDTGEEWVIRAVDGCQASLEKSTAKAPDVTVITTSAVLTGVMDKRINGMMAYMQRKIQIKGPMEDLIKLQKLMM